VIVAILFTDIVGSTNIAAELGDARWRALLARHHETIRRSLRRFRGREVDTAGDGFFATFPRPADAIRAAAEMHAGVRELGIAIRCGVNFGECEVLEGKPSGLAVVVASRTMSLADAGDLVITESVRQVIPGLSIDVVDRGTHALKGIEGEWRILSIRGIDGQPIARPGSKDQAAQLRSDAAAQARRTRFRWWAAMVAVPIAAAVGVLILFLTLGAEKTPTNASAGTGPKIPTDALVQLDPESGSVNSIVEGIPFSHTGNPRLAVGEGGAWILASGGLIHVDLDSNHVSPTKSFTGCDSNGHVLALANGTAWVGEQGKIERVSAGDEQALRPITFAPFARGSTNTGRVCVVAVASGEDAIWSLSCLTASSRRSRFRSRRSCNGSKSGRGQRTYGSAKGGCGFSTRWKASHRSMPAISRRRRYPWTFPEVSPALRSAKAGSGPSTPRPGP
jgi:hypothetical protein